MFDVGFSEILVIAIVALIVLGPERLPKAARTVGRAVGVIRAKWAAAQAEINREMDKANGMDPLRIYEQMRTEQPEIDAGPAQDGHLGDTHGTENVDPGHTDTAKN